MTSNGKFQVADAFKQFGHKQLAPGLTSGFSRISYKGHTWKLVHQGASYFFINDEGLPLQYLDVVIIDANPNTSKLYYPPGSYTEESANAPTCASTNGDRPDPGVAIPQNPTCHDCIHNQWLPNRGGKECQDHRRLAILLLPYMKTKPALDLRSLPPIFFKVPPASLKSFKSFSDMLDGDRVNFFTVITRITFDPTKQFQLNFDIFKALTNAEAPAIIPLLDSPTVRSLTGSIAEIKQVEAKPPPLPTENVAAFGGLTGGEVTGTGGNALQQAKRGPGRPKKPPEQPAPMEAQEQAAAPSEEETAPWEDGEGDADLDKRMGDILGKMTK